MDASEQQIDWGDEDADADVRLETGVNVGPYTLLVPLGRGGMAWVWTAYLPGVRGFGKTVAVKTILPAYARNDEYARMFLDEARAASAIHHPNVCEILQLGRAGPILYMAMEFVAGGSLYELMRGNGQRAALPRPVAARIIADACSGLHAAHVAKDEDGHALDIIHRDVSPHNILISPGGHTKIADFGIVKARNQLHSKTRTGEFKGKVSCVAPEQLAGVPCDARLDIFALGCVLYEATLGVQPFRADTDVDTFKRITTGDYVRPRDADRSYPPELHEIVVQALETSPNRRFQSASDMRIALETWLAREGEFGVQNAVASVVKERLGARIASRKAEVRQAKAAMAQSQVRVGGGGPSSEEARSSSASESSGTNLVGARDVAEDTTSLATATLAASPPLLAGADEGPPRVLLAVLAALLVAAMVLIVVLVRLS